MLAIADCQCPLPKLNFRVRASQSIIKHDMTRHVSADRALHNSRCPHISQARSHLATDSRQANALGPGPQTGPGRRQSAQTGDRLIVELPSSLATLSPEDNERLTWTAFCPGFRPASIICPIPAAGTKLSSLALQHLLAHDGLLFSMRMLPMSSAERICPKPVLGIQLFSPCLQWQPPC